jgi:hypothetical protein
MFKHDYREKCLAQKINVCNICASDDELHVHHINGDRSDNRLSNLIPLCTDCHQDLHSKPDVGEPLARLQDKLPDSSLRFSEGPEPNYVNMRIPKEVRDRLRRYKAEDGDTYGEAISELLEQSEWEA